MTAPHTFQDAKALPARPPRDLRAELVTGVALLAGSALLGLLMGALWHWLAPRVPLYADSNAVYLKDPEGEQAIGADGTFALIGLGIGLLAGAAGYLATRARQGGVTVALGLTAGGVLGGYIAVKFGTALGPGSDVIALAKSVPVGHLFYGPLKLSARGVLVAWPIAALLALLALTALFTPKPELPPVPWETPSPGGPDTP